MPIASSPSNPDRMPVINAAAREPVNWRSTNADLDAASPLTLVVEKVNRTQNNITHMPTFPLALPVETTVGGIPVVENPPGLSNEQEAGIIIGSLLLLIIIGILLYCWLRYRKRPENILLLETPSPTISQYNTPSGGQGPPTNIPHPSAGGIGLGEQIFAGHGVGSTAAEPAEVPRTEVAVDAAPGGQDIGAAASRSAYVPAAHDNNGVTPQETSEGTASGQGWQHQDPNIQHPAGEEIETQPQGVQPQLAHQTAEQNVPARAPAQQNYHRPAAGNSGAAEYREPDNQKYSKAPLRGILSRRPRWSRKRHDPPPGSSTSRAQVSQAPQQHFAPATQHDVPPSAPEPPPPPQRPPPQRPPPQRPPPSHAMPRRHVTFQDNGHTQWETGGEGTTNQEEPPFFFRLRPDADNVSEFHRRGDEQAARFFNATRSREGRFAKYRRATYPLADARSASAHPHQPAPSIHQPPATASTGRRPSRQMPTVQYYARETPQMREAAETQGIEQAWQHVMDEQAAADDFYDWYDGVSFYTNQMGWRATYIEDMREHRAQQRAQSLREAVRGILAYCEARVRR